MEAVMKTESNTTVRSESFLSIVKPFLAKSLLSGLFGFSLVFVTLATTYFVTAKIFNIGYFVINTTDLLISSVGFILFAWVTLRKKVSALEK